MSRLVYGTTLLPVQLQAVSLSVKVKWHPSHQGLSNQVVSTSDNRWVSRKAEIDMIFSGLYASYCAGYMDIHYWNSIEDATAGTYNWANVDQARDYIQANYPGKLYSAMIWGENFGSQTPGSVIPSYIYNNSAYGSSNVGGQYGFWYLGTYGITVAWWRTALAARVQALFAALAAHQSSGQATSGIANYDADPYFYATTFQESALDLAAGSDATQSNCTTQWIANNAAFVSSFPHTNVISQNNFTVGTQANTEGMWVTERLNRLAAGGPDVFGASGAPANLTWGQRGYVGLDSFPDQRPNMPYFAMVQSPDYASYTVTDIGAAAQGTGTNGLKATNIWWQIVTGGNGNWGTNVVAYISANPILNTAYPANYP